MFTLHRVAHSRLTHFIAFEEKILRIAKPADAVPCCLQAKEESRRSVVSLDDLD